MKSAHASKKSRVDPELARDAAELRDELLELVRACQFWDRNRICCHDVSVTQCYAIDVLCKRGPLTLNALADELWLDKTTMSRVVATLVRKGYVSRSASPDDGRSILLRATPAGTRLRETIREVFEAEATALLADVSPAVRTSAIQVLRRLTRAIASCCAPEDGPPTSTTCASACGTREFGRRKPC